MDDARAYLESLLRLDEDSFEKYKAELRAAEAHQADPEDISEDWQTLWGQFQRSDAGHPLGRGYPPGAPIGGDTAASHRHRWMAELRDDPCAYCGRRPAGTIDHIQPKVRRDRATHVWVNYTASCAPCNSAKGAKPMLLFLLWHKRR